EELEQATTTLLTLVYGKTSQQFAAFSKQMDAVSSKSGAHQTGRGYLSQIVTHLCQGTLRAMKADIDAGFTGNLRQQITGEVLTDLIQLSRTILYEQGEKAKNVAAVLAAAAFEDTIRRMGATIAGVLG